MLLLLEEVIMRLKKIILLLLLPRQGQRVVIPVRCCWCSSLALRAQAGQGVRRVDLTQGGKFKPERWEGI
jgi:hypothetical protein